MKEVKTLPTVKIAERYFKMNESYIGKSWNLLQIPINIDYIVRSKIESLPSAGMMWEK